MYFQIFTAAKLDRILTYKTDFLLEKGQIVLVSLKNQQVLGVVLKEVDFSKKDLEGVPFKIKSITKVWPYVLSCKNLHFCKWLSEYNLIPQGIILKMMIPFSGEDLYKTEKSEKKVKKIESLKSKDLEEFFKRITLTSDQSEAAKQLLKRQDFAVDLIDGVTGSGKTELYFFIVAQRLYNSLKKQVLILLPEIALTLSLIARFEKYFKIKPFVWHSRTTKKQKFCIWEKALLGEPIVVIGARSALFLPFSNLATIIIDEEHDPSYKQNEQGTYNARDMGIMRGKIENIPVILVSATPSLETIQNIKSGKFGCVKLPSRFAQAVLPTVSLVDMKQEVAHLILSTPLTEAMRTALSCKEQILLFVNQRGYAPLSLCRNCGYRWKCPMCDVYLIEHKASHSLLCHYCGYEEALPHICPECQNEKTRILLGIGTERVFETVQHQFPKARCLTLSSDTISSKAMWLSALQSIYTNEVDIILGTQMLAKGHHFPHLTVVGVIDADQNLNGCNLRANERTYQLLDQVSGRAGRDQKKGHVFLQTYHPENPLLLALQQHDRDAFYACELKDRQLHDMPPFKTLIAVIISGRNELDVQKEAHYLAKTFPRLPKTFLLGPAPAPFSKLRGKYRYRLLIKTDKKMRLQKIIPSWIQRTNSQISLSIDVDPYEFT